MKLLDDCFYSAQDLGDPVKQPAWARLQHELPPAVSACTAASEQMVAAPSAFLVRIAAPKVHQRALNTPSHAKSLLYGAALHACVGWHETERHVGHRTPCSHFEFCGAGSSPAEPCAAAAGGQAVCIADLASWAAVERWQDVLRQQDSAASVSINAPAVPGQRLFLVQLGVVEYPPDAEQLVQLVVTVPGFEGAVEDASAKQSAGNDAMAAPLRCHLTDIEDGGRWKGQQSGCGTGKSN